MSDDTEQLEREIAEAEETVKKRQMALKLSENYEFRKLFLEDYFVKEAARLVQLSSDPNRPLDERADAMAMAQATGHTRRYLSSIVQMGAPVERNLPHMRDALNELRSVEVNE